MTTEKNNKLIAEFMGMTYEKNIGWYDNEMRLEQIVYDLNDGNCFDELQFKTSWDWLMPVVDKMNTTELWEEYDISYLATYLVSTDINATYNAVVEFINEYNKIK